MSPFLASNWLYATLNPGFCFRLDFVSIVGWIPSNVKSPAGLSPLWHLMQYRSRTGWTLATNVSPLSKPGSEGRTILLGGVPGLRGA